MTTNEQPRRLRRQAGEGSGPVRASGADQPVNERLRLAREARGVDLFRVERDTKIRVKYLKAMEQGQFSELPADVYARGFLRNYASYLGLDPDQAELDWRRGNVVPVVTAPAPKAPVPAALVAAAPAPKLAPVKAVPRMPAAAKAPAAKAPAANAQVAGAQAAASPAFRMPAFKFPKIKWPMRKGADAASATSQPVSAAPQPVSASPSILESPPWNRRVWSLGIPAFLRTRGRKEPVEPHIGGPQPLARPRRLLLLQPIHIVLLLLAVVIVGVGLFFGMQATRVLQDPTLTLTKPEQAVTTASVGSTTFQFQGKATRSAEISIQWDSRDPMHTTADTSGNWTYLVSLHSGINQFDVWSTDLETNHNSQKLTRLINVPTPTASPVPRFLAIDSPTDGQAFRDGIFTVFGTTVAITTVTITATYLGVAPAVMPTPKPLKTAGPVPTAVPTLKALPTATPTPSGTPTTRPAPTPTGSGNPAPVEVIPTIDGKFQAPMHLWSGRWMLSVVGTGSDGISIPPVEITVIVTAGSLVVVVNIKGGSVDLKLWKDGKVMAGYPHRVLNGASLRIVADQSVWIRSSVGDRVLVTVNGVSFGRLGSSGRPAAWRITAFGPPVSSNDN